MQLAILEWQYWTDLNPFSGTLSIAVCWGMGRIDNAALQWVDTMAGGRYRSSHTEHGLQSPNQGTQRN